MEENYISRRADAFLKEFPFVARYVSNLKIDFTDQLRVKRIDEELLNMRPSQGDNCYGCESCRYFLIDGTGQELAEVKGGYTVKKKFHLFSPSTWGKGLWIPGQTVQAAIKQLKDVNELKYALKVKGLCREDRISDFKFWREVTITVYKIPAGIRFSEWLIQVEKAPGIKLKSEISEIDSI